MATVETTKATNRIPADLHQNQTNSSKSVCANTLWGGIVHLERIVISLTVNTNCDCFQTKKTGTERKTCKSNSCLFVCLFVWWRAFVYIRNCQDDRVLRLFESKSRCSIMQFVLINVYSSPRPLISPSTIQNALQNTPVVVVAIMRFLLRS